MEVHTKKKFIALALFVILITSLTACVSKGSKGYESNTGLVAIPGANDLYYDSQTKVVYFVFNESMGYTGYGYMSAYYAPNGLPYLYDPFNQELAEISYAPTEQTENLQPNFLSRGTNSGL